MTYCAIPILTKEAINASAIGTFRLARRRHPAIIAVSSSITIVLIPLSFSALILVLAASTQDVFSIKQTRDN